MLLLDLCDAGCVGGFIPCPDHRTTEPDAAIPFCVTCDNPMVSLPGEPQPRISCPDCE